MISRSDRSIFWLAVRCVNGCCFWFPEKVGSVAYGAPQKARTISGIYCQLGDYMPPSTLYKNLKNVLNARVKSPAMSAMLTRLVLVDCGLHCWNCHDLNTNNRHDTIDLNSKKTVVN